MKYRNKVNDYENYRVTQDLNKIEFKYREKEVVDFSNECYDK